MRGPSAAFSILLSTAALAQTNNCETAYRLISDEDSDVIAVVYRKDHPFRLFNFAGQRIR